jgi:ribonuclease VapC
MFVDASALVAILAREPDWEDYAAALGDAPAAITSPLTVYETARALARLRSLTIEGAVTRVYRFLDRTGITIAPIDRTAGDLALSAFARYGKGRGHPAQLNLGDCFAYGMAKANDMPLLYKGGDFALTDIRDARPA